MRLISSTLPLAGAVAMFAAVGCTQESQPGGPGAASAPRTTTSSTVKSDNHGSTQSTTERERVTETTVTDKANTFTLNTPKMETTLDSGKKKTVDISISRGSDFKQSVKIEFKPPAGVTVTPAMATIPAGQDKVSVTLEATNTAPAGKTQVQVMAVPETGKSVSLDMPVEVKHAS